MPSRNGSWPVRVRKTTHRDSGYQLTFRISIRHNKVFFETKDRVEICSYPECVAVHFDTWRPEADNPIEYVKGRFRFKKGGSNGTPTR